VFSVFPVIYPLQSHCYFEVRAHFVNGFYHVIPPAIYIYNYIPHTIHIYIPYGISPLLYGILRKSILGLFFDGSKYHRMHIDELSHLRAVLSMISSGVSPWTWNPVLNEPGVKWNRVLNTAEVAWKANTHLRSSLLPNNLNYFPDLSWSSQ
jgi:hypothetical protein